MAMLDHWHPVIRSRDVRGAPVGVKLAGREIVLFRDEAGRVGALTDVCCHRRMRLSKGAVVHGRLKCPYHGWTFDIAGRGESPATPKLHACVESFETQEALGVIWIKSSGSPAPLPVFDVGGFLPIAILERRVKAPLEVVLDNFCETEHTATVHQVFGFDPAQLAQVKVRYEATDTTVTVHNSGPPKRIPQPIRFLIGVGRGQLFHSSWVTYFSPVWVLIDHWWADPATGREALVRWRVAMFFSPRDECDTVVWTFAYAKSRWPIYPGGGLRPFRWLVKRGLETELDLDFYLIENLADPNPSLEGMKLSRFDRPLALNRERIQQIYRGEPLGAPV